MLDKKSGLYFYSEDSFENFKKSDTYKKICAKKKKIYNAFENKYIEEISVDDYVSLGCYQHKATGFMFPSNEEFLKCLESPDYLKIIAKIAASKEDDEPKVEEPEIINESEDTETPDFESKPFEGEVPPEKIDIPDLMELETEPTTLKRNPRKSKTFPEVDPNLKKVENYNMPTLPSTNGIYQSWQLTKLRYDFSLCEKNIFLKVVEVCQRFISDKNNLGKNCFMDIYDAKAAGKVPIIYFPIKDVLTEKSMNYAWVKNSLLGLQDKKFGVPGINSFEFTSSVLFQRVMADKKQGLIGVMLSVDFWEAFCNLECYKKINIEVARSFKSVYSERIYELLVGNKTKVTYDIENLKRMFCLEVKYKNSAQFLNIVIKRAQKDILELESCPFFFEYELVRGAKNKIVKITFEVKDKKKEEPADLEKEAKKTEMAKAVTNVTLTEAVKQAVMEHFPRIQIDREDVELKLKYAQSILGVNELVSETKRIKNACLEQVQKGKNIKSSSGYYLGSLDKIVTAKIEEEKAKHVYVEPERPKDDKKYPFKRINIGKDDEINPIGEDSSYWYYTDKFVVHAAKMLNMDIDEWRTKYCCVRLEGTEYWRVLKD